MFYSGGLPLILAKNPHYQMAYAFAATHNIADYVPPGYNKLRTLLLLQEKIMLTSYYNQLKQLGKIKESLLSAMVGVIQQENFSLTSWLLLEMDLCFSRL
ncbi:hypothetical protein V6N12_007250 [Hibiscus sabdariffa]|uniref:Uncharacterized protein n=1 Tax=Hibiscus sabdariffa TaxID=183260 RepID=A0ABR2F167_9ROSI